MGAGIAWKNVEVTPPSRCVVGGEQRSGRELFVATLYLAEFRRLRKRIKTGAVSDRFLPATQNYSQLEQQFGPKTNDDILLYLFSNA